MDPKPDARAPRGAVGPGETTGVTELVRDPGLLTDTLDLLNGALDVPFTVASRIEDGRFRVVGIADDLGTGFSVGTEFDSADSFCARIANTGTAECIPVVADDDLLSETYPHTELGLEAYLGIPVVVDGRFYGTIAVCDTTPRDFTDDERARAHAAARVAASALRFSAAAEE